MNEFIGRFHPLFVHLPIGILLIGLLFHWLSKHKKYVYLGPAVPMLLFFGAISAGFSCLSGYLLSLSGDYEGATLDWHMWMGIGVFVLALLLATRVTKRLAPGLYTLLGMGLFILISITGHLGGSLTHGEDYILNPFAKEQQHEKIIKVIPDVQQALVYQDIVQPILQNNCYACHGPSKQKGKFRMDSPQDLIKGGKGGEAILVGNAAESELIRRLLLPIEDKKHMSPRGKRQLTANEISLLHWWIEKGADLTKLVSELEQPAPIKPLLLALQSDQQEIKALPIIPSEPIEVANSQAIQSLKDAGIVVMPVASTSNYLMVNFVMAPEATDEQVALLSELKEHVIWLKIGDTKISDAALAVIGTCTNLIQLQLNHTEVTDLGMAHLKGLERLQTISLVGTKVTAQGVKHLRELKDLQAIYLYQSAVDKKDVAELTKLFATTTLDTGGYVVPTLVSDTTLVL